MPSSSLTPDTLAQAAAFLASIDPDLGRIYARLGPPPLWERPPGFPTLVWIILEQQVSLASASAAFHKLERALGAVTPEGFVRLSEAELKQIGFSGQKSSYCRLLAQGLLSRQLDVDRLDQLDDLAVRAELVKLKGIGPWTADIYLLMALLRPDIWPAADLALVKAVQEVKSLPARPGPEEMERIAAPWRPWRAVAARMLWQHYLANFA